MSFTATDVTVVIPTIGRWPILQQTLAALQNQTANGFEVVVVVDGAAEPPALSADVVLTQPQSGPGAARNRGAAHTSRPLVLCLGDDMIPTPTLVERHLSHHARHPGPSTAVLGKVQWHPKAQNRLNRWLDWSGSQFDFASIRGEQASWAHFYSCNVSFKREFFLAVGGFDDEFVFDYEDLDIGWRLGQAGLDLRFAPDALVQHLHRYDWDALVRRYRSRALGEALMARKHPWFEPFFAGRLRAALMRPSTSPIWPLLADVAPRRLQARVRRRADVWYHQQLADPFFDVWEGNRGLDELRSYLGDKYDQNKLFRHVEEVEREEAAANDERTFYRTSEAFLYDLTAFAMTGTKTPYLRELRRLVPPRSRLLDYGCGIGSDGLRLMDIGYELAFADFDNPSMRFLRWRLEQRGLQAPIYDVEKDVPGGFDAAYSFDVIEHVDDPFAFLGELESRARIVAVNFLEPAPSDPHPHHELPVAALLRHVRKRRLLHHRRYHARSHLVIYENERSVPVAAMASRGRHAAQRGLARLVRAG